MSQAKSSKRVKPYCEVESKVLRRGSQRLIGGEEYRGHSLTPERLEEVLERWRSSGEFVSPYSEGIRTDHLRALAKLGVNEAWDLGKEIKPVLKGIMLEEADRRYANRWERFAMTQRGRNPSDVTERIYDNYRALRRLCMDERGRVGGGGKSPYGKRLWQIGCCIDIFTVRRTIHVAGRAEDHVERYIRLNTYSREPLSLILNDRAYIPPVDRGGQTLGPS